MRDTYVSRHTMSRAHVSYVSRHTMSHTYEFVCLETYDVCAHELICVRHVCAYELICVRHRMSRDIRCHERETLYVSRHACLALTSSEVMSRDIKCLALSRDIQCLALMSRMSRDIQCLALLSRMSRDIQCLALMSRMSRDIRCLALLSRALLYLAPYYVWRHSMSRAIVCLET